ncbi:hypothetical protein EH223_12500 [candidate division KSB1 bacterium]|nr:hypothetical protein [candidate division KSB1 bacterium]RQW02448.1 MAG: hypothetical protein EH223_12500 [candidate division KSB1 bacterium]
MNIIDYPEKFCIHISGTFNRGEQPPLIFQRSNGTLQKKLGPIIPTNPRTRLQQLNRILFRAALDNADSLSEMQKEIYRKRIPQHQHGMSWRVKAIQDFMKPNKFGHIRFNESMLFGGLPLRDAFRLNEITFDDAFLTTNESLPLNKAAIQAKYPNIDISSIFPETE